MIYKELAYAYVDNTMGGTNMIQAVINKIDFNRCETSNPKTLVQSFTIVGNGAPPPDVVRTQIMQVAYYLRSEMRQNKVAMLFEMLSQDLLDRNLSLTHDKKIVKLQNQVKLIQLLLALQTNYDSDYEMSNFAKHYLEKNKVQLDLSRRDIEMFDQRDFENKNLQKKFSSSNPIQLNRFNVELQKTLKNSAQKTIDLPTPLFGALLRQTAGEFAPLTLPQLPRLDSDGSVCQDGVNSNINPYVGNQLKSPKVQERKQISRDDISVWNLMPHIKLEAPKVQRLWEDESIHISQRNLKVTETGLITKDKEIRFKQSFKSQLVVHQGFQINEQEFVKALTNLILGIPTQNVFELHSKTFTFELNPNFSLKSSTLCFTDNSIQQFCEEFLQVGTYLIHLREFQEFMAAQQVAGQVVEQFCLGIHDFLMFYHHQINDVANKAALMRQHQNSILLHGNYEHQRGLTLLEFKVMVASLLKQVQTLARICFTQRFIDDISIGDQDLNFQSLLYTKTFTQQNLHNFHDNLDIIRRKQWLEDFPKGAHLLNYLYKVLIACEADQQLIDLLRQLFQRSVSPILTMITDFVLMGKFTDPFEEFFIEQLNTQSNHIIFRLTQDQAKIPIFFASYAQLVFKTGRDMSVLQQQNEKYYNICASQNPSPFQLINTLEESNQVQQKWIKNFDSRIQILQQNELQIQELEQQYIEDQIKKRQVAAEFRLTEFEKEKEIMRQQLLKKKQKELEILLGQIESNQQAKMRLQQEEQKQLQRENEERERLKQLENMIANQLKAQLMEILGHRAKLADVRSKDVIERELLDQKVFELEQQIDLSDTKSDVVMQEDDSVDVEQIDVEMETESEQFVRQEVLDEILLNVFKCIDEKRNLQEKRKTQNLQHQQQQISKAKQKRQEWKPEVDSVKTKLDALFAQVQTHETSQVPVTTSIEQSLTAVGIQAKLVNKCLLHMMYRQVEIVRHFEYLKMVYLANQGDFFQSFILNVFNDDFQQTAKDSSINFLNTQFEICSRQRPKQYQLTTELSDCRAFLFKQKINTDFYFTINNASDFVYLDYQRESPVDKVITQTCLDKYNSIFFFLLKIKKMNLVLNDVWKELNLAEFRRTPHVNLLKKTQLLRHQMHHFVKQIDEYVMTEVIYVAWSNLQIRLQELDFFEDLISLHSDYVDYISDKCFISKKGSNRLMTTLDQMFGFIMKFRQNIKEFGVDILTDFQAKANIRSLTTSFNDYSKFLLQVLKQLAQKGQFKELYIRLDFNRFQQIIQ